MMRATILACFCAAAMSAAEPDMRVADAAMNGDRAAVRTLLGEKASVSGAQGDGMTALHWAAYRDDVELARALLAAGANPRAATRDGGLTPLSMAATNGSAAMIELLLKAGADVNAPVLAHGETALMMASRSGNVDAVKMLLAHGAQVNAKDTLRGTTALMWAAEQGHAPVVALLAAHGADVRAVSKGGFTALLFAAVTNDSPSTESLLTAGADPNYALPGGPTALIVAVSYRSVAVADLLADRGANPNVSDREGNTPLHVASRFGDLALVEKLLAKGANVNARTAATPVPAGGPGGVGASAMYRFVAGEQTPLMLAAKADHVDVMRALAAAGADAKLKAQDGTNVLSAAVGSGHLDAVQYAYELSPDVEVASTRTGGTLLHAAVVGTLEAATEDQICEVIRFLAAHGAPLDDTDVRGRTPLFYASLSPIDKAVTLLQELIIKSGGQPKIISRH